MTPTPEARHGGTAEPRWTAPALIGALLVLAAPFAPAHAQETAEKEDGYWEIGLVGGVVDDRPEFTLSDGKARLAHEGILGGRLAVHLPSRFFLESEVLYTPVELISNGGDGTLVQRLDGLLLLGGAGYRISVSSVLALHLRSGLGGIRWDTDSGSEVDFIFNAGTGLRLRVSRDLALRVDGRWHLAPSALASAQRDLNPDTGVRGEPLWLGEATAGLSVYLGR